LIDRFKEELRSWPRLRKGLLAGIFAFVLFTITGFLILPLIVKWALMKNLSEALHRQVTESINKGAVPLLGCTPVAGPGYYYPASLLDQVKPGMPAYEEELFGPVAVVIRAEDEADALRLANDSRFGLGGAVCTRDAAKGETFARAMQCGQAFVNGLVKSDPRLPFGGIKASGYGRELGLQGIREFVNAKVVWLR